MSSYRFREAASGRYYDEDGRPVGHDGKVIPHRPVWFSAALDMAAPEVVKAYKRIPDEYVEEDVEDETYVVKITCPCGEAHLIELNEPRISNCNRHFAYLGEPHAAGRRAVFAMQLVAQDS